MRNQSVTIKASIIGALITGFFTVIAVIITIFFSMRNDNNDLKVSTSISTAEIIEKEEEVTNSEVEFSAYDISNLLGIKSTIKEFSYQNIDLVGNGKKDEYLFNIITEKYDKYHGVVSRRNVKFELLYYVGSQGQEEFELSTIYFDEKPYLLVAYYGGSANYMLLEIYEYDGFRVPKLLWKSDGYSGGFYIARDSKVYIYGDTNRYVLNKNNDIFELTQYLERYDNKSLGSNHVLRIDISGINILSFRFDDIELHFNNEMHLISPIELKTGELIVIDDNIGIEGHYIRYLYSSESVNFINGFFRQLTISNSGEYEINVSDTYSNWYKLVFNIKDKI